MIRCFFVPRKTNILEPAGWRAPVTQPKLAHCTANKYNSSPDDILFSKNVTFSAENLGWRAPVALPKLAVCTAKKYHSSPDDIISPRFVTFSAENLGWWYLNSRGSYSAVRRRYFPIQADVAVKRKTVAKTFQTKQTRAHDVCTPSVGNLFFFVESFWDS